MMETTPQQPTCRPILTDYVAATFRDIEDPLEVMALAGSTQGWHPTSGGNGYRKGLRQGHVDVVYDGSPGMGVHLRVSGKGCRQLEAQVPITDWRAYLLGLISSGAAFTRLDFALDDQSGEVFMSNIIRHTSRHWFVSRCNQWKLIHGYSPAAGDGVTAVYGSPHAPTQIHIYDKAAEQATTDHWVRVETRFLQKQAHSMAQAVVEVGPAVILRWLRANLLFKEHGTGRRPRWPTCPWWDAFLGTEETFHFGTQPRLVTLDDQLAAAASQYGRPIMQAYRECGLDGLLTLARLSVERYAAPEEKEALLHSLQVPPNFSQ